MKPRLLPYGTGLAILLGLSVLPRAPALLLSHPCRTFMPTPSARVAHPVAPDACTVHDPTANAG